LLVEVVPLLVKMVKVVQEEEERVVIALLL
jgi:hypothetical protein